MMSGVIIGSAGDGVPIVVPWNHPAAQQQRDDIRRRIAERAALKAQSTVPTEPKP